MFDYPSHFSINELIFLVYSSIGMVFCPAVASLMVLIYEEYREKKSPSTYRRYEESESKKAA